MGNVLIKQNKLKEATKYHKSSKKLSQENSDSLKVFSHVQSMMDNNE